MQNPAVLAHPEVPVLRREINGAPAQGLSVFGDLDPQAAPRIQPSSESTTDPLSDMLEGEDGLGAGKSPRRCAGHTLQRGGTPRGCRDAE